MEYLRFCFVFAPRAAAAAAARNALSRSASVIMAVATSQQTHPRMTDVIWEITTTVESDQKTLAHETPTALNYPDIESLPP